MDGLDSTLTRILDQCMLPLFNQNQRWIAFVTFAD
jgi:hypothetical protein